MHYSNPTMPRHAFSNPMLHAVKWVALTAFALLAVYEHQFGLLVFAGLGFALYQAATERLRQPGHSSIAAARRLRGDGGSFSANREEAAPQRAVRTRVLDGGSLEHRR